LFHVRDSRILKVIFTVTIESCRHAEIRAKSARICPPKFNRERIGMKHKNAAQANVERLRADE
jgi:hypothetical protein